MVVGGDVIAVEVPDNGDIDVFLSLMMSLGGGFNDSEIIQHDNTFSKILRGRGPDLVFGSYKGFDSTIYTLRKTKNEVFKYIIF